MKTLTITISVPDGVEVNVTPTHQPAAALVPSGAAPAGPTTDRESGTPVCSRHGIEKRADSKFGGYYCQGKDGDQWCNWKWKP